MKAFVRREKLDSFPDAGSSGKILKRVICLIMKGLQMALFFAFPTLFVRKLLIISKLLVEAAGVEPDISVENAQLTDSRNDSFAGNAMISKSTVRSLYSDCQQFPEPQPSDLLLQMRDTLKCSATFIHQSEPENRQRDQVSMFHASPQREGELDMPKDSGDVIALQLLDTFRLFKCERMGTNSP